MSLISVVIPVFDEQECLLPLFDRLNNLSVSSMDDDKFEFIFVDDGSTDSSREIIKNLAATHSNVKYLFLSRNFGHEAATTAGLDYADGDAVVIIDADLQDPPEVIPSLIEKWRQGYQIVYAQRRSRQGEPLHNRITSWLFYRFIRKLSRVDIPVDTGDFRLIDRCVVEQFRKCREQDRFVRGLITWTGFKQTGILYDRDERFAGKTKYNTTKRMLLALDVVLGFSNLPLRIGITVGLLICLICFIVTLSIVIQKLFLHLEIPGYALIVTGIFFVGGMQLAITGLIGEYIGRIYRQSQNRPLYIISAKSD